MLPVTSSKTKLFKMLTTKASLNPNMTNVTRVTMFESPSLAPGIATGNGIKDSITDNASPTDTNKDKSIIFLVLFICSATFNNYDNLIHLNS